MAGGLVPPHLTIQQNGFYDAYVSVFRSSDLREPLRPGYLDQSEGVLMGVERSRHQSNLIDILDRVLDKGIVIDAWIRISLVGVYLVTIESRVVIASIETYLMYATNLSAMNLSSRPRYFLET